MQNGKQICSKEFGKQSGDRHSFPRQVLGRFIGAMHEFSEMQTMVSRYRRF